MFVPCYEHCYLKFGKQYSEECDDICDYAKASKENKELERILVTILNYYNYKECIYCKRRKTCLTGDCNNFEKYELDLDRIKADYQVE